jgi:glutaredoxin-related protein
METPTLDFAYIAKENATLKEKLKELETKYESVVNEKAMYTIFFNKLFKEMQTFTTRLSSTSNNKQMDIEVVFSEDSEQV